LNDSSEVKPFTVKGAKMGRKVRQGKTAHLNCPSNQDTQCVHL